MLIHQPDQARAFRTLRIKTPHGHDNIGTSRQPKQHADGE